MRTEDLGVGNDMPAGMASIDLCMQDRTRAMDLDVWSRSHGTQWAKMDMQETWYPVGHSVQVLTKNGH